MFFKKLLAFWIFVGLLTLITKAQESEDYLYSSDEGLPIQILKKGHNIMGLRMCLIHPRNCPRGFRKRGSSTEPVQQVPTDSSITKIILQKNYSVLPLLRSLVSLKLMKQPVEASDAVLSENEPDDLVLMMNNGLSNKK